MQQNYQQDSRHYEENKYSDDDMKYDDLKNSLLESQNQLVRAKANNQNVLSQYKDAQDEIENCHDQIARQASVIHDLTYKNEDLNRQVYEISNTQSNLAQKSKIDITSFQNEIEQKDD